MQPTGEHSIMAARVNGILLIAASLLSILAMSHHPTVTGADIAAVMAQLTGMAGDAAVVHGVLIALMLLIYYTLTEFAVRRGVERPLVRAGLIAYGAGVVAMIGAAAVSGFITAKIPLLIQDPNQQDLRTLAMLVNFSGSLNQAMANIGVVAISAGILAWSIGLLHSAGWPRVVGGLGVLIGVAPAVALITGGLHLNVHGMMLVVLAQAVWNIAIGGLLISGKTGN